MSRAWHRGVTAIMNTSCRCDVEETPEVVVLQSGLTRVCN
jgi:hypothetical protein